MTAVAYPTAPMAFDPYAPQVQVQVQPAAPCQCAECNAWRAQNGIQTGRYTHSPYGAVTGGHLPPAEVKVVRRERRTKSVSSGQSDAGSNDSVTSYNSQPIVPPEFSDDKKRGLGPKVAVTLPSLLRAEGRVFSVATTPHGSSFLQAALHQHPAEAFEMIHREIEPVFAKSLLDKNACYVAKLIAEMMDRSAAMQLLQPVCADESLLITLCTKDLHSRRMVQFLIEFLGGEQCRFLFDLVMRRPLELVRTQQGCITLQRILDAFGYQEKEMFFDIVRGSFMEYALDPFGNYIVQYMLTEGNQVQNSQTLALYCRGQLHHMVCHKYGSNVIEKCFGLVTPELQHQIIEELFIAPEQSLMRLLSDSAANYVVQAAIRAASYRDATIISDRLTPLIPHVPYGRKLQKRLERRLNH